MKTMELGRDRVALVDDEDLPKLSRYRWRLAANHHCEYAVTGNSTTMHRVILDIGPGIKIDHRDGNGLNNQKSNLRPATHAQNMANRRKHAKATSVFKGVHREGDRWTAEIKAAGKKRRLGGYSSEVEAALAYDRAAHLYHGEFARTNF